MSYAQLGLVMTVYFAATALVQVPIGMLVDRIGARWGPVEGRAVRGAGGAETARWDAQRRPRT